jgi:large subunit ribosomal protein L32e
MNETKANPEKALKLRKRVKHKKPQFVRPESWKYIRLKENWRRPQGLDNKARMRIKGWPARASSGYRGPKGSRSLHPSGFEEVIVYNTEGLKEIDAQTQAARIAHTVGKRKRSRILTEARSRKIVVLNMRSKPAVEKKEESSPESEEETGETEGTANAEDQKKQKEPLEKPSERTEKK